MQRLNKLFKPLAKLQRPVVRQFSTASMTPDLDDSIDPTSRAEWRSWLERNHDRGHGIWLITYNKASGKTILAYDDIIEEALCFGWIDGPGKRLDAHRAIKRYAPRRKGSGWSRINKERIERLKASGQMAEPGLLRIEAAQQDGSWALLDDVEDMVQPDDLVAGFAKFKNAQGNWDAFPPSAKRSILQWIVQAKTDTTRAKRIEETARLADKNQRANQWPRPPPQKEEKTPAPKRKRKTK